MAPVPDVRTGLDAQTLARAVREHLFYETGRQPETATLNDVYLAVAATVRDRLFHRVTATLDRQAAGLNTRAVAYLSAEFLMGPQLGANLLNLDIVLPMRQALSELGLDLYAVLGQEEEPGLGNGGLGRLSACYLALPRGLDARRRHHDGPDGLVLVRPIDTRLLRPCLADRTRTVCRADRQRSSGTEGRTRR